MLRWSCAIALVCSVFAANRAQAYDWTWGEEHPAAKAALLKIFENHRGFREALVEYTDNHHAMFKDLVVFLATRKESTIHEFIKDRAKDEKETPVLKALHEKYVDGFVDFRDWIHDHKDAAIALTNHEGEIHHLEVVAERRK